MGFKVASWAIWISVFMRATLSVTSRGETSPAFSYNTMVAEPAAGYKARRKSNTFPAGGRGMPSLLSAPSRSACPCPGRTCARRPAAAFSRRSAPMPAAAPRWAAGPAVARSVLGQLLPAPVRAPLVAAAPSPAFSRPRSALRRPFPCIWPRPAPLCRRAGLCYNIFCIFMTRRRYNTLRRI